MPKRGRPPKDPANRRDTRLSVRISKSLRDKLQQEAGEQSLSEEVEFRLRSSFEVDMLINELFGSMETRVILQILAEKIRDIEGATSTRTYDPADLGPAKLRWFSDPFVYSQVKLLLNTVFEGLRPGGRRKIPKHLLLGPSYRREAEKMGKHFAVQALADIQVVRDRKGQDAPVQYRLAARSLGGRLKGSPNKEYLKDQQRLMKLYFTEGRDHDK